MKTLKSLHEKGSEMKALMAFLLESARTFSFLLKRKGSRIMIDYITP